ncbi:hypothetical protein TWF694_009367 [Orbilia ellipsospora]|uniref:Uncharacterized protein n=1 Tax=Orbilia ellipsospora TaxID=2528407 RepID=A0AAV9XG77_9PEZI
MHWLRNPLSLSLLLPVIAAGAIFQESPRNALSKRDYCYMDCYYDYTCNAGYYCCGNGLTATCVSAAVGETGCCDQVADAYQVQWCSAGLTCRADNLGENSCVDSSNSPVASPQAGAPTVVQSKIQQPRHHPAPVRHRRLTAPKNREPAYLYRSDLRILFPSS